MLPAYGAEGAWAQRLLLAGSRPTIVRVMDPDAERLEAEGWTPYAPIPGPERAVCSFCGRPQGPDLNVVLNADGTAGICAECCESHARFFARRN